MLIQKLKPISMINFQTLFSEVFKSSYLQYLQNKNKQKVKQNQEMFRKTLWKLDIVEN